MVKEESKKLPAPVEEDEQMEERCTCKLFDWPEQVCPFANEILEAFDDCNCCPYHYKECLHNI
jgi:hypothetical protein